jgi:hypothetical protein
MTALKRGHIILLSGAALLIVGIAISAIWGVSFASTFVRDNTIVAKTTIDAGKSIDAKTNVNQLDKAISLAVGTDKTGGQASTSEVRLKETITDPNGKVVSVNEFGDSFLTSFKPETTGVYTVAVTNLGTKPVTISGTFGVMPFMGAEGKPDIKTMMGGGQGLGMIIAGGGLAAAGVVTLVVGGIITAIDSREKSNTPTKTSEGGITYRKD